MLAAIDLEFAAIILGVIIGMTYGLLAVGLVLVYRSSRVINFAHGEIGAFAGAVFGVVVTKWNVPYYLALPGGIALGGLVGVVAEVAVVRRLRKAPLLMQIVATIGIAAFLQLFSLVVNSQARGSAALYPQPPWLPEFDLGPLRITRPFTAMLVLTPLLVAGLAMFLQRSRIGMAIRGSASNAEAARLAGISAPRMSSLTWAIAGGVAAFTAILQLPTKGFGATESFGPELLLRALAAAVLARMTSLPIALSAGVTIGVVEQLFLWNSPDPGIVDAALLALTLGALLVQRRFRSSRQEDRGSWLAVAPWEPLSEELLAVPAIRRLGWTVAAVSLAVGVALPIVVTNSAAVTLTVIIAFAIVGLSIGILSGLAGQISLGQFGVAGIGATASWWVIDRTENFVLAFAAAALVGAFASVLLGIPAVRIRGLMFAVATLAFAQAVPWLIGQSWLLNDGEDPRQPVLNGYPLDTSKRYYYFALAILVIAMLVARNVREGSLGRRYRAVRDNEDNARAFSVAANKVKLEAFGVAGALAGVGGAVYGHSLALIGARTFLLTGSISAVAIAAVGGIGVLGGPLLGGLYIIGFPRFVPLDSAGLAATALGWLLLILYFPGGLAQVLAPLRSRLVGVLAARAGVGVGVAQPQAGVEDSESPSTPHDDTASVTGALLAPVQHAARGTDLEPLLRIEGATKRFGGVVAVDGVDLVVAPSETVGLIGPNGAGKTTLFELIGGFTTPDGGTFTFAGEDITAMPAEQRARRGLIRSFQDAALFPTMTVLDAVRLSLERRIPTRPSRELLGLRGDERRRDTRARELVSLMGLSGYRDAQITQLSTGTRRVAELACLLALEPRLLLLDEPTSGIAQRETEALADLLDRVKDHLGTALVVIEHDIPLVMAISDRIVAMAAGAVLADGPPEVVRANAAVIDAYLGTSTVSLERSGVRPAEPERLQETPA